MKRDVTVISLRQFESAGGLADGYSFEDFLCPLNKEVQEFLQKKAVQSLHLGASMTYLVYDNNTSRLLGYFTLVLKPFSIEKEKLSKTRCRLIERFADVDNERYTAAVYLIAQIGAPGDCPLRFPSDFIYSPPSSLWYNTSHAERDYTKTILRGCRDRNGCRHRRDSIIVRR